ncbi:MAG: Ig-like domain-containing protein, partial [Lachnospiraceae bacterium]
PGTETEKQPGTETEKQPGTETEKQPESETEKQPETEKPAKPAQNKTSAVGMRLKGNASSTKVKLAWTKIKGADGYEIYGVNCRGSKKAPLLKTIKKGSAYVTTIKGLKKASSYRYYVKAYKMVNGKKTYLKQSNSIHIATAGGSNTNAKKVTVESSSITLKKGETKNLNAKIVSVNSEKELLSHIAKLTYTSTDQKIATVTNKGTVKAKAKGTCYIYVSAANGRYKKVKITVK